MRKIFLFVFLVFISFAATSCTKLSNDVSIPEGYTRGSIIGWHLNCVAKLNEIKSICSSIPDSLLKYDVDCYKIEYVTLYLKDTVRAEGLVVIPRNTPEDKFAVYCHGTNIPGGAKRQANSFYDYPGPGKGHDYNEIIKCILPLASNGYCTFVPEYTGYGSTSERTHCFVYGPELQKSIIDGILASHYFLELMGLDCGSDIYLTGWSQGGAAALAAEYYLEGNEDSCIYEHDLHVKAVSALSGPFNLNGFIKQAFTNPETFNFATTLYCWAAYAINYFDELARRPADQIFLLPVYDQSEAFLSATGTASEIFRPFFMENVLNGYDHSFCDALNASSYDKGWCPKAKVFLHHGKDDKIVPFFNSQDAYDNLSAEGADITLYGYEGKGHFDYVHGYMTRTLIDFAELN